MPELPEVETIKNVLKSIIIGKTITDIDILRKETIIGDSLNFKSSLINKTFLDISRKGKFLIFHLSDNIVLISHLRMEGKYFDLDEKDKNTYFSRIVFHLNNSRKLCYDDSRCFGIMILSDENNYLKVNDLAKLGPEPSEIINSSYLFEKAKKIKKPIKTFITDQSVIAGIGNIYADEILYACKIHPLTHAKLITLKQWDEIINNAKEILNKAIQLGGSTIRSYHPGKNIDGKFQSNLKVYGKFGQKCPICNKPFRFIKINGRGTTFCPNCQIKLGSPIKIAVFGKIASGKSTLMNQFSLRNYETISCDEEVHNLYKNKDFSKQIGKLFNVTYEPSLDLDSLRKKVSESNSLKKQLENLVWPKVKENILIKMNKSKSKLICVEVPLLFESKMNDLFDYIIGIDISKENQINRIKLRNKQTYELLLKINSNNQRFELNKEKADIIIENNGSNNDFIEIINNIIYKLEDRLD